MQRIRDLGFYLLLFFIGFIIGYTFHKWYLTDMIYIDQVVSGSAATILGVMIGIPVALAINRINSLEEESKKEIENNKKNIELLKLINQELEFNLARLNDRMSSPNALQRHPYQTEVWDTFSNSGEVKWIKNYQLINRIASAYSIIKIERSIEEKGFLAAKGEFAFAGTEAAVRSILEDARSFDSILKGSIEYALAEISKEIEEAEEKS